MTDMREKQSERIRLMLSELGISASELARQIGCTPAAVCQWTSGKRLMRTSSAELIEKKYPLYSADWLTGKSDHQNLARSIASVLKDITIQSDVLATIALASSAGYQILTPFDIAHDIATSAQATFDGCDMPIKVIGHGCDYAVTLDQLTDITGELADFLTLRLKRLERQKKDSENG